MRTRRALWWGLPSLTIGLLLLLSSTPGAEERAPAPEPRARPASTAPVRLARAPRLAPPSAVQLAAGSPVGPTAAERAAQRALWERRLDRARSTLDSYLEATRYPPESRPISEHPDRIRPSAPERTLPLDPTGDGEVMLILRQEKVFVVGEESVHFFVRCQDREGAPLPCEVVSAVAHEAPHRALAQDLPGVPLAFADDGSGTLIARFQPSTSGFPMYEGTLRVDVTVRSGTVQGGAVFDVMYTPAAPAIFTGQVRDSIREGSLQFLVEMQVRKPGRYVVTGRVDDATGTPFALLTFNEELGRGRQQAKLILFGRLVLDERPVPPFTLRDVEGFLLRESGDPDREVMAARLGPVHTTRAYPESVYSSSEWQSEERDRHVKEFTRDLEYARDKVSSLTP